MKTNTTFKGAPKPLGKSGHFYEPRRHSLQAKGIKTGNYSAPVYESLGIQNVEPRKTPIIDVPTTSEGLENIEAEAIQEKEAKPKKVSFSEKLKKIEQDFADAKEREKQRKAEQRKEKISTLLGKDQDEEKVDVDGDADDDIDDEPESVPTRLGTFLADVTDDYSPEDMVGLTDKELELLAVRFKTQTKDSANLFGEPENPFVAELKRRLEARAELRREKAEVMREIRGGKSSKEKGILSDLFFDEPEKVSNGKRGKGEKSLIGEILDF